MQIMSLLPNEDIHSSISQLLADQDAVIACKGQMMLDLVNHLEADGPAPAAFATLYGHEIWLRPANQYNRAMVRIGIDWFDRSPLRNGLPTMHYRLQMGGHAGAPTRDGRSCDLAEVQRLIWEAFGWSCP